MKKKGNNKGFTLVELIVVLVILAILAAILVPALLGYIDSARNKQTLLNARSAMTAAQAELSAIYGANTVSPNAIATTNDPHKKNLERTADLDALVPAVSVFEVGCKEKYDPTANRKDHHGAFTVTWVHYKDASAEVWYNGKTGEWSDTTVSITDAGGVADAVYKVK
ncbi:MAG: type II secretion system protein [Lachnospiraceae bacterium]|nr:type II secretion system protein [Lachnospiraceae bacterium]